MMKPRTVADLRNIGTAMMRWLTDQVGAAAAGQETSPPYDVRRVPQRPESRSPVAELLSAA